MARPVSGLLSDLWVLELLKWFSTKRSQFIFNMSVELIDDLEEELDFEVVDEEEKEDEKEENEEDEQ